MGIINGDQTTRMAQSDIGTIDPNTTSGTQLAALLNNWAAALRSSHSGAERPAYVQAGMIWAKEVDASTAQLMFYDGDADVLIGTVDKAANRFTAALAEVTAGSIGAVPTSRQVATQHSLQGGGTLAANRTLSLVGDTASPGARRYYGTDANGTRGFHALPDAPKQGPVPVIFGPGSHTFTVPAGITRLMFFGAGGGGGNRWSTDEWGNTLTWRSGGYGAVAMGSIAVAPGANLSITVGAAGSSLQTSFLSDPNTDENPHGFSGWGGTTTIAWYATLTGGEGANLVGEGGGPGTAYYTPSETVNLASVGMMIRGWDGTIFGHPACPGIVVFWYWA